jgi:hypothetical protein
MRSVGQISLEKTKWLTLSGSSLAVLSSTAFYINGGLYFLLGGLGTPFWANPYLHIFVFGVNLDSVLNDFGMLLACGVAKKITFEAVTTRFSTAIASKPYIKRFSTAIKPSSGASAASPPASTPAIDSGAYEPSN